MTKQLCPWFCGLGLTFNYLHLKSIVQVDMHLCFQADFYSLFSCKVIFDKTSQCQDFFHVGEVE